MSSSNCEDGIISESELSNLMSREEIEISHDNKYYESPDRSSPLITFDEISDVFSPNQVKSSTWNN